MSVDGYKFGTKQRQTKSLSLQGHLFRYIEYQTSLGYFHGKLFYTLNHSIQSEFFNFLITSTLYPIYFHNFSI